MELNMDEEDFLTLELVEEIMGNFDWPAPYALQEEALGIMVSFPKCSYLLQQGFEGDVVLTFLQKDTQYIYPLKLGHALLAIVPEAERKDSPLTPGLINDQSIYPSEEKMRNYLKDTCTILLFHLQPCLLGDFSWVQKFKEQERNKLENK